MMIWNRKIYGRLQEMQKTHTEELSHVMHRVQRLQEFTDDILSLETQSSHYNANKYPDAASAIMEIDRKYRCLSNWGNQLTGNIIDFRSAMIMGDGLKITPKKSGGDKDPTKEFIEAFIDTNSLDHEAPLDDVKEAEIEGRYLTKLTYDKLKKSVMMEFVPWIDKKYQVEVDSNGKVIRVTWIDKDKKPHELVNDIKAGTAIVYKKFGGRKNDLNDAQPKIMRSLTQIEHIDMAFRDWREIDRLYVSPRPVFETLSDDDAKRLAAEVASAGKNLFKIKAAWVVHGKFSMVGPDMAGIVSLEKEIIRLACFISGSTGYPLQFLLPDMLANRSTSENIMESSVAHTTKERGIWIGVYEEIMQKAAEIYNVNAGMTQIDAKNIQVDIPRISKDHWDHLIQFYLPAVRDGKISDEMFLGQIPGADVQEELKRQQEAEDAKTEKIVAEMEQMKNDEAANENNPQNKNMPGQSQKPNPFNKETK